MEESVVEPDDSAFNEINLYVESELDVTEKLAFSDSDPESPKRLKNGNQVIGSSENAEVVAEPLLQPDSVDDNSDIDVKRGVQRKNCNKLIDSDSEEDDPAVMERNPIKLSTQFSAQSSCNESDTDNDELRTNKVKKLRKKIQSKNNGLDENELTANLRKICDDESSADDDTDHSDGSSRSTQSKNMKKASKQRPPQRMSAKEAGDQMKLIQSESQRLARESNLNVPYHIPKKHSLKEFLSRRNINKSVPVMDSVKAAAAIKMSKEDLIEFAKKLDERAIESQQFYKSDTSSEDEGSVPTLVTAPSARTEVVDSQSDVPIAPLISEDIELATNIASADIDMEIAVVPVENGLVECTPNVPSPIAVDEQVGPTETNMNFDEFDELVQANIETAKTLIDEIEAKNPELRKKIHIDYNFGNDDKTTKLQQLQQCVHDKLVSSQSPSIKGCSNSIIDLDTGDILTDSTAGVDGLFQRFLKHTKQKSKKHTQDMSILTTSNGLVEMEQITLTIDDDDDIIVDSKPRSAFFKLKQSLSQQLAQKRKDDIMRRKMNEIEMERKNKMNESESGEEEDLDCDEKENEADDTVTVSECFEATANVEDNDEIEVNDNDEIAISDNDEIADSDNEVEEKQSSDEQTRQDETNTTKTRKRIFVLDDSDNEGAAVKESDDAPTIELDQSIGALMDSITNGDCQSDTATKLQHQMLLNDSAKQPTTATTTLFTQTNAADISDSQLLDLCSGAFVTQVTAEKDMDASFEPPDTIETDIRLAFESSDDEIDGIDQKLKRNKKKTKRLSVQEDDSDGEQIDQEASTTLVEEQIDDDNDDVEENDETDDANRFVDYDSEENEIEVIMEKKERVKKASEFFENEADLSGSDWGSADEDENNMDRFDIELGDEDEFDQAKIQSELERIHMRRLLDKDAKDIKKIQDLLFEDEEDNGLGRERQFKWKNVDSNFDEQKNGNDADDAGAVGHRESDDENEEQWRKMRHERELMLKENGPASDSNLTAFTTNASDTVSNMDVNVVRKRITIIKSASNTPKLGGANRDSPFLINKGIMTSGRNSFLKRDEQTLSKLAHFTKNTSDSDGAIPSMVAAAKQRNFVFTTLSPAMADKVISKRKSTNDSANSENQQTKKAKTYHNGDSKTKKKLLDILT